MKLVCSFWDEVIEFKENIVNTIIIENQNIFRRFLMDIYVQTEGYGGDCILSEKDMPVPINKKCELINDFINFDINKKSLIASILTKLENTAINEEYYVRTNALMSDIEKYIYDISLDNDLSLECSKLSVISLLKMAGITLKDDYDSTLEKILDYMELVRIFERDKLFILVNIRSYFNDHDIQMFIDTIISHSFKVLMVESSEHTKLEKEKRITVDKDMCVF